VPHLNRRSALALTGAGLSLGALGACATTAGGGRAEADAQFEALTARWLDASLRLNPIGATGLGDHRFDGEVDDISAPGRAARVALARSTLAELGALPRAELSRANQVDAALLQTSLEGDVWTAEVLRSWEWDPLGHVGQAGSAMYGLVARTYAPLPQRLNSAAARMDKLPLLLQQARGQLRPERVPRIHAETVLGQTRGLKNLIDGQILSEAAALSGAERDRLNAAAAKMKAAVDEHARWIETTLIPGARGEFRIGAALYDQKLAYALNSPLSRAEIRTRGEAEMTRIRGAMYVLSRQILSGRSGAPATPAAPSDDQRQAAIEAALELAYADRPARDGLVAACERSLQRTTAFVRAKDLLTLPPDPVRIILVPEFQRGVAVAYCDAPGPLDRGQDTFYMVSPIPDAWTAEQATSFLREYNNRSIEELTVHEAMPGHFVQLAHANRYPSTLRAVLGSGPFIEGWACYAQDVVADAGYLDDDPLYRLIHHKWELRVVANALLDQGVHVDGMTREAAMRLMTRDSFQQEREAAGKWVRAQLSSAQLPTYFVGWEEHKALRAETQRRWGAGFTQKRYHDAVLSFGSPPVRYARQLLLDEPIA